MTNSFRHCCLTVLLGCAATATAATPPAKPNIIFIMADDLGYTDVACFGSKYYETPHIDRLATQGMKLISFHQSQNCAPSRAALMSGQYGARTGLYTVGGIDRFNWQSRPLRPVDNVTDLPLDRDIIARQLKAGGYATAMFGKWHIGEKGDYAPGKRGFDEAIVSSSSHFDFPSKPQVDYPKGTYLADFLTDRAIDFIRRHKDQPFFIYLPHFGVHVPLQAKAELIAKFKAKPGVGGHNNPVYAAMIASVDESVGRIMALLDELKLADNTVLVFTSDNGGFGGFDHPDGLIRDPGAKPKARRKDDGEEGDRSITDNTPLRSGKGSFYEGGTRVPFIVRWPGVTMPDSACGVPAAHVDVFPTLLEISGSPAPRQTLDGESLVKLFRDPLARLQRQAIYQHFPGYLGSGPGLWRSTPVSVIQDGDWKLMEYLEDGHLELYNLRQDIGETKNLASEQPAKAAELQARLAAWRQTVNAPMPAKNTPSADASAPSKKKSKKKKSAD